MTDTAKKATVKRKEQPKQASQDDVIEKGLEAQTFIKSKEFEYLESLLDKMEDDLLFEKQELRKDQAQRLNDICIEIDLLTTIKHQIQVDINLGKSAQERQAKG